MFLGRKMFFIFFILECNKFDCKFIDEGEMWKIYGDMWGIYGEFFFNKIEKWNECKVLSLAFVTE